MDIEKVKTRIVENQGTLQLFVYQNELGNTVTIQEFTTEITDIQAQLQEKGEENLRRKLQLKTLKGVKKRLNTGIEKLEKQCSEQKERIDYLETRLDTYKIFYNRTTTK